MTALQTFRAVWLPVTLACGLCVPARAAFISNGGFESGFNGWTRVDQTGSEGTFSLQTGTTSPVTGENVPAPPRGSTAAMTDAEGPGSHLLFQNFMVAAPVGSAVLMFDLFVGNRADAFYTPADTLDFSTPTLNQQARVDILTAGAEVFSVMASDVLLNAFKTNAGDPLVSGYTHYMVDITGVLNANVGNNLMLRFAEVDNVNFFQLGVDNVDIAVSAVPEPSYWIVTLTAVVGILMVRGRARSRHS
jgi:hypothetical protein